MNFEQNGLEIAVIGISGRFPGSNSVEDFWQNLLDGKELTSIFSQKEGGKIEAGSILKDIEKFDASFFGFNPREAEVLDPQHRLFLESAWEALEIAGYDSQREKRPIGVFAGVGLSTYWMNNIYVHPKKFDGRDGLQNVISFDKDYVPTLVSYKLNLTGPSFSVGTACSSSLVAVHLACQSLLAGECDLALAAGVAVKAPQNETTLCPGEIVSPEGKCRAFDANAKGIVGGNGLGVVTLKRLEDAIADRDCIYAVIKGSAMNNDGAMKVGYTAPSETGQVKVLKAAQMIAEVDPETITYIEAHGTGTALGDPIEVAAMTEAFRSSTQKQGYCAIGSVKTNVGHLDAAAGITGFIKAVLAVKSGFLPPSLHFEQPNPQIDFENSPFYVNTELKEWRPENMPRRAGVNSFGIGGTNVHVILEEAPELQKNTKSRSHQLLLLSAKTDKALEVATNNLGDYLNQHSDINLADVAYTLQVGRKQFQHRRMMVVENLSDAVTVLNSQEGQKILTQAVKNSNRPLIFMFTGQGSQYVNMGRDLYENETIFRDTCDQCFEILKSHLKVNLKDIIYPDSEDIETATEQLQQTALTQPALFVIEYALAKLWMSWGIIPQGMIGHSIGEYVAACLADVFTLEDALMLVANRGKLMQELPPGAMLSVNLSSEEIVQFLDGNLSLAAINGPKLCVISGDFASIEELEIKLKKALIAYRRLHTSHAFHSPMMEPIVKPFTELVKTVSLKAPSIPFISNVTGNWIQEVEAIAPIYWARHLCQAVQFYPGINQLLESSSSIFLEVGPGRTLTTLTKQVDPQQTVLSSFRHPKDKQSDIGFILQSLGQLWLGGIDIDWDNFYQQEERHRLPLPTYPFERQKYWIEPSQASSSVTNIRKSDIKDWFYLPSWKRSKTPDLDFKQSNNCWLIFVDNCGLGKAIIQRLENEDNQDIIQVEIGEEFKELNEHHYVINPNVKEHYQKVVERLFDTEKNPIIAHLWTVNSVNSFEESQIIGYQSIIHLTQAIGHRNLANALCLNIVSSQLQQVTGEETICPEKATLLGPVKVISQEYLNITSRSIDVVLSNNKLEQTLIENLIAELTAPLQDSIIAYRGNYRWIEHYEKLPLEKRENPTRLRQEGVYLITGGTGGIGLVLAEYLAKTVQAKLVLLSRSANSNNLEKIQNLEQLGAEVLILQADVSNEEEMQKAFNKIYQKFGMLNGIVHAAGLLGKGAIQEQTSELSEPVFAAKVKGTLVLEKICKNIPLDFLYLWSSISSIIGGFGQVDYAASNAFLDKNAMGKTPYFKLAINWDIWQNTGMASNHVLLDKFKNNSQEQLKNALNHHTGIEAFSRLENENISQAIVTPRDLSEMLISHQSLKRNKIETTTENQNNLSEKTVYSRPNLSTNYVAPSKETEKMIAEIWQDILGVEKVGIYDNFFELGGHSLLATQTASRLQESLKIELTVSELLQHQTIAEIAQFLNLNEKKSEEPDHSSSKITSVSRNSYRLD